MAVAACAGVSSAGMAKSLLAVIGVAIFGTLLAIARTLKGAVFTPIRLLAAGYTDIFRGIPLLLVLYIVGFGVPGLELTGRLPAQFWGTIALILTYSAYVSEVLRAGIEAVGHQAIVLAPVPGSRPRTAPTVDIGYP